MKGWLWFLVLTLALPAVAGEIDFATCFAAEKVDGAAVLYDREHGFREFHPGRCQRRYVPASTFKIPNSLIGLECGVLPMDLEWDGVEREIASWNQDMSLDRAFRVSAVHYYQEVARQVGLDRMRSWVERLGYGNAQVGKRVDRFWLDGPLAISPREQVEFLERLHDGRLPVSKRSRDTVVALMDLQQDRIFAKTGWARTRDRDYGWWVGWVEREQGPLYFAVLVDQPHPVPADFFQLRIRLGRSLLKAAGAL